MRWLLALLFVIIGVLILIDVKWSTDPLGLFWAALNAALFAGYIILGHQTAEDGASGGVEWLGAAKVIAFILLMPIGVMQAVQAFGTFSLVLAGVGVCICSSLIPCVCDQLAMSRLPRASLALMLALLPAIATLIAVVVLAQIPTYKDMAGVLIVMPGIAVHNPSSTS